MKMYDTYHKHMIDYKGITLQHLQNGGTIKRYADGYTLEYGLKNKDARVVRLLKRTKRNVESEEEEQAIILDDTAPIQEELFETEIDEVVDDLSLPWSVAGNRYATNNICCNYKDEE